MSTARSDGVHEKWRESTEKFDYFILGVVGALCAYISQTFKPERIGLNPGTLELLALLVLVLGAVFGFRRVEQVNLVTLVNYRILHANERRRSRGRWSAAYTTQSVCPARCARSPSVYRFLVLAEAVLLGTESPASFWARRRKVYLAPFLSLGTRAPSTLAFM